MLQLYPIIVSSAGRWGLFAVLMALPGTLCCVGSATATAVEADNIANLCIYDDRAFSEGALICVQKSLMLRCERQVGQLIWRVPQDEDFWKSCIGTGRARPPTRTSYPTRPKVEPLTTTSGSAKCFIFNGSRYCE